MKAQGDIISTIIMASTIIVISIVILYYALSTLDIGLAATEYGYVKSTFVNIANNFHLILQGNSYAATLPSRVVGVGYHSYSDVEVALQVNTGAWEYTVVDDQPTSIVAGVFRALVNPRVNIVYGSQGENPETCSFIVDNIRLVPCIREYYRNGESILEFDTMRYYVSVYLINESGVEKYLIRIIYVKLVPILEHGYTGNLMINPYRDIFNRTWTNVLDLEFVLMNTTSGTPIKIVDIDEIVPSRDPTIPVEVVLIVKQVVAVIG